MAKKQPWEQLSDKQRKEATKKAVEKIKGGGDPEDKTVRKMIRVSEECHAMAKAVAGVAGLTLQDYLEQLVMEDAKTNYPEVFKRLAE